MSKHLKEALQNLLDGIHAGRFVPDGPGSSGYCNSLVEAGESALIAPSLDPTELAETPVEKSVEIDPIAKVAWRYKRRYNEFAYHDRPLDHFYWDDVAQGYIKGEPLCLHAVATLAMENQKGLTLNIPEAQSHFKKMQFTVPAEVCLGWNMARQELQKFNEGRLDTAVVSTELTSSKKVAATDEEITVLWNALQERRASKAALQRAARIGATCALCGKGKLFLDGNGYHAFERCDACGHVPVWGVDNQDTADLLLKHVGISDEGKTHE